MQQYAGEYRDRIYPPLRTLALFMGQALSQDGACQDAVARHASERSGRGMRLCSLSTGPYCKARSRLPMELVVQLQRQVGRHMVQRLPHSWRWRAHPVKLLDGTTVSMPDTPANQEVFPQYRSRSRGWAFRWRGWWGYCVWAAARSWIGPWGPIKARAAASRRCFEPCSILWKRAMCCWQIAITAAIGCWRCSRRAASICLPASTPRGCSTSAAASGWVKAITSCVGPVRRDRRGWTGIPTPRCPRL